MTAAASPAARAAVGPVADSVPARCRQCGVEHGPAPLCSNCGALLPLPADADHYQVFGIPRRLDLDAVSLSSRYYELSRLLHPDRHSAGPAEARAASMLNTAALTRAYRTLREPVARALYWLELHGRHLGNDNRVPPELAALVFEVQEKLEELHRLTGERKEKLAVEVRHELEQLRQQRDELLRQLEANFRAWNQPATDSASLLESLESILSRRAYLQTLIRDVEAALAG